MPCCPAQIRLKRQKYAQWMRTQAGAADGKRWITSGYPGRTWALPATEYTMAVCPTNSARTEPLKSHSRSV